MLLLKIIELHSKRMTVVCELKIYKNKHLSTKKKKKLVNVIHHINSV